MVNIEKWEKSHKHDEEENSIEYKEKVGSYTLSITKEKITYGDLSFLVDNITGIRYGVLKEYTNGIPSKYSYAIWITDKQNFWDRWIFIECASGFRYRFLQLGTKNVEKQFNEIVSILFTIVQVPLIQKMISDFEAGQPVSIAGLTIDHSGFNKNFQYSNVTRGFISLTAKIFGKTDIKTIEDEMSRLSWKDYGGYSISNGKIVIFTRQKKEWASLNLREDWNAVNLGIFLDFLHKHRNLLANNL